MDAQPLTAPTASQPPPSQPQPSQPPPSQSQPSQPPIGQTPTGQTPTGQTPPGPAAPATTQPTPPIPRTLVVEHDTRYTYEAPVRSSEHVIRLRPVHDAAQQVLEHTLEITPWVEQAAYEDVFGNQSVRVSMDTPYSELLVRMRAVVQVDWPELLRMPSARHSLPLTWMPWQREMMHAYLLPPELPESQLRAINDYAWGFAERHGFDVAATLVDINTAIWRDFAYVTGSTTNETTPFEVFAARRGVCQDFANLFICMARLLGIPARYRVGYIFTGGRGQNAQQSEATHAWAEAYLPNIGWRGFDPTNGIMAAADHVRVAVGRIFRDATPTSGTIFGPVVGETLSVRVDVRDGA